SSSSSPKACVVKTGPARCAPGTEDASAVRIDELDQAAVGKCCAERAQVALDLGDRASVLPSQLLGRVCDGLRLLQDVEHPRAGAVDPVIPARAQVQDNGLVHELPVDDVVGHTGSGGKHAI